MKLTLQDISKTLNGKDLFTDFSLELQSGMRLCICGSNGVGKSVLMRIMAQKESVDKGTILIGKHTHIGYAEQELDTGALRIPLLEYVVSALPDWTEFWNEWNTAIENEDMVTISKLSEQQIAIEQRYGYNPEHHCANILFGLGFEEKDLTKPVGDFSGGFRERAKLARVLVAGADILLLDEPINHLDIEAIEWLEAFLMAFEGIVVFIAHDRIFMDTISTHTLFLGMSKPFFRKANYSQLLRQLEELEEQKQREADKIAQEIDHKMAFVERFKAKASKARQAGSRQKMAKKLEKELELLAPEKKQKVVSFAFPSPHKADKTLIAATNLSKSFGEKTLWNNIHFSLYNDSKVAIVGHNGAGKSTLFKILLGTAKPDSGTVALSPTIRVGYFSQHQSDILQMNNSVLTEIRRLADPKSTDEELMGVLGRFLLGQAYFERPVSALSGGEKNRLILASIFLSRANILLLDEPTNHLDLETREALTTALQAFTGAILLIAHDRHLLQTVAQEYWLLSEHGIDTFSSYEAIMNNRTDKGSAQASTKTGKEERKKQKQIDAKKRTELYQQIKPKQEEYARQERRLEEVYKEITTTEALLANPEHYENSHKVQEAMKILHALQKESTVLCDTLVLLEEEIQKLEKQR